MKVFLFGWIGLLTILFLDTQAQQYPYCIQGRFAENDLFNSVSVNSENDVIFGTNLNALGGMDTLKLNIHYPNLNFDLLPKRPLIVMAHAGSFTSGSRTDMDAYCLQLARRGYVAATVDYRLGWNSIGTGFPCTGDIPGFRYAMYRALQDVNAALRFLVSQAADYKIDTSMIFLAGQSAGAFTVMNCGFMDQNEANVIYPGAVADLGGIHAGTNTINANYSIKGILNWCGGILDTNIIDANERIPVLSLHGLLDNIVPVDTGTFLFCYNAANPYPFVYGPEQIYMRMQNLGICSETNYDENGMHCFYPSLEPYLYVPSKYTCFFKNLMCGNCQSVQVTGYNAPSCMDSAPLQVQDAQNSSPLNINIISNSQSFKMTMNVSESGLLQLRLLDLKGAVVQQFPELKISTGWFVREFSLLNGLSQGLYILQMNMNHQVYSHKMMIP
ncbi:MAG: alpha/beta hydrolase [Chitinophagaceae bacterium]|nr:alpha/beta hydrolase [Chitinophagaceae bacterium]